MNELTDLIERATADQPPLSITRDSAVAAGRRALRRRRQGTAVLGVATVAAVVVGITTVPQLRGTGTPTGGPSGAVDTYDVPQMPVADGVPGAAAQPSLVGTDPRLMHFSVPTSSWPVGTVSYLSDTTAGAETVMAGGLTVTLSRSRGPAADTADVNRVRENTPVPSGSTGPPTFIAGHATSTPTTVGGRPATLNTLTFPDGTYPSFGLLWQPVDGLWVGMFTMTRDGVAELWADVAALRLDVAERIVVPFQLTSVPDNAHLLGLQAGIPTGDPYAYSSVTFGDDLGNTGTVSIGQIMRPLPEGSPSGPSSPGSVPTSRTVAGHQVTWTERKCTTAQATCGGTFYSDDWGGVPLELDVFGYDEAAATQVLTGLHLSRSLKDQSTWFTDPVAR